MESVLVSVSLFMDRGRQEEPWENLVFSDERLCPKNQLIKFHTEMKNLS